MKTFRSFLKESSDPGAVQKVDMSNLLGALRLAGINAGERDTLDPFITSKGIMGLSTAANKVQDVLRAHGYLMGEPLDVQHDTDRVIRMRFPLFGVDDETKRIGEIIVNGNINPIDKTTMSFRAELQFPPHVIY